MPALVIIPAAVFYADLRRKTGLRSLLAALRTLSQDAQSPSNGCVVQSVWVSFRHDVAI